MIELPSFLSLECEFLAVDTPKGEDLILVFEFLNNLNCYISWRQRLKIFNHYYRDSSYSLLTLSNYLYNATYCAYLGGDFRIPSFPPSFHIPSLNSPQYLLLYSNELFKEIQKVGEDNSISSLHLFHWIVDPPPSSHNDSLEELWDEKEEKEEF
ncbi:hypothetical protein O181_075112 [Austropuccinia psidii MF-1]|uniref:Uncharacterized protein n=1 Tax=Austropuccinia psidii MF-1 TaxID=1389203 RepID=A0A9Q3FEB8_9BASI|nr:hypothetical protein [Austropuccinia psidii MF-1]